MNASSHDDSAAQDAASQDAASAIGTDALRFLVGAIALAQLWRWLGARERTMLRNEVTKGFKSAPGALRHGLAQTRLARHLQRHDEDFQSLLAMWAATQGELLREIEKHLPQNLSFDAARVLASKEGISKAPEAAQLAQEAPQDAAEKSHEEAESDARAVAQMPGLSDEVLDSLRSRFGEPALQLAQLYLGHASPDEADETRGTATNVSRAPAETEAPAEANASTRDAQNEAERALWQRRLHEAKAARDAHRQRAGELAAELETLKTRHQRELHELRAQLVKSQKDAAAQRETAAAAQKNHDRETRRARQESAQRDDAEAENKRLKRQIRQLQQSTEDARRSAATATSELQEAQETIEALQRTVAEAAAIAAQNATDLPASTRTSPRAAKTPAPRAERVPIAPKKVAPIAPRVLDPLDEVFRWNAADRDFAVTLREAREMISRNDETRVFALSRALEALRESDEKTYLHFLSRLREFGPYFRRVLTVPTARVLVDASNVARIETDRRGRGKLDFLLQAREELRRRDAFPLLFIADASLQHFIDEPSEIAAMAGRGELVLLPAGNVADDFIAREARRTGAFVLTNDKSFHKQVAPDYEPSRISFKLHHHFIEIDEF